MLYGLLKPFDSFPVFKCICLDEDEEGPTPDELEDDVPMGAEAEPEEEIPPPGQCTAFCAQIFVTYQLLTFKDPFEVNRGHCLKNPFYTC